MEIFSYLIRNKLNIVITTHSDIMLRKVSNLLGSYYLEEKRGEFLDPKSIRLYFLKDEDNGSILKNIEISKVGMIESLPSFDEIIHELYEEEILLQQEL